jgi:hypothetical protein
LGSVFLFVAVSVAWRLSVVSGRLLPAAPSEGDLYPASERLSLPTIGNIAFGVPTMNYSFCHVAKRSKT